MIKAANHIDGRPYVWGGGHRSFSTKGYDCSGAVSYALHGGGLLETTMVSGQLASWGETGVGRWITVTPTTTTFTWSSPACVLISEATRQT